MIKRKLAMAGRFACLYAAVFVLGSAIFGVVTEHVGDYQLLRLIIMSAVAAGIMAIGVTFFRARNPRLKKQYRAAIQSGRHTAFLGEFFAELAVTLVLLIAAALLLMLSGKQLLKVDGIANLTLATYLVPIGIGTFTVLDLFSWAIAIAFFKAKK